MDFAVQAASDIGKRETNQDAYLAEDKGKVFMVADGVGGHAGGEVASQLCVEEVKRVFSKDISNLDPASLEGFISEALNEASKTIFKRALSQPALRGMGTTAEVLVLHGEIVAWGHVGDSRIYHISGSDITQLTEDHSLVQEQVRAGTISPEEAETHKLRNVITRCIGFKESERVDTGHSALVPGDRWLLCSDGLSNKVPAKELYEICCEGGGDQITKLIDLAKQRGGEDNITAVLLEVNA